MVISLVNNVAVQKQEDREAKLATYREWRISVPDGAVDLSQYPLSKLTETERAIVKSDATRIVELIRKRVHTSQNVLTAFVKVAVAAQDITNCLSEVCFEEAFVRARELDQYMETTGNVVGPLHGLPVSIKDHIKIKGLDTSSGYLGEHSIACLNPSLIFIVIIEVGRIKLWQTATHW
jgi:amidase